MNRQHAIYFGEILLVLGAISVIVGVSNGILGGTTAAGCITPGKPPLPSVDFVGLQVRIYGLYDSCNYTSVSPLFVYGFLGGAIGGIILGGEFVSRDHPSR